MQRCPICSQDFVQDPNYPYQVCPACVKKAASADGRRINFHVDVEERSLHAVFVDSEEDYDGKVFLIDGRKCEAIKTHFDQVIVQLVREGNFVEIIRGSPYVPDMEIVKSSVLKIPAAITTFLGLAFILFGNVLPHSLIFVFFLSSLLIGIRVCIFDKSCFYFRMMVESVLAGLINGMLGLLFLCLSNLLHPELQFLLFDRNVGSVVLFLIGNVILSAIGTGEFIRYVIRDRPYTG